MSIELPTRIADVAWRGRHVVRRIVRHIDGRIDKPIHGRTAERRQTASVGRRGRRSTISLRAVAAAVVAAIAANRARRRRASLAEAVRSIVAEYRRRLRSSAFVVERGRRILRERCDEVARKAGSRESEARRAASGAALTLRTRRGDALRCCDARGGMKRRQEVEAGSGAARVVDLRGEATRGV
ncbi:hypothetical protein [Burkholderia pseudomallei]|uniref:hypothetical protein n=1 Tax=Burkholderia pseudomallei TaxID=28450 RepID=UPI002955377E|nr:hypothetical protein [Burkholderia pseudomallei]